MSKALTIAADELRYWRRSRLAVFAIAALVVLTLMSVVTSVSRMSAEEATRESYQAQAQQALLSQPARHPHRMVHYGHYVFRPPPALAVIDPGIDELTGRSVFLEGHRQNTATFAAARETSILARFGELSPAFVMQTLVPLLLILIGFSSVVREREAGTLAQLQVQGVHPAELLAGKALALAAAAAVALAPLGLAALWLVISGSESFLPAGSLILAYALYLACACLAVLAVSAGARQRSTALAALLSVWVLVTVIVPRVASEAAAALVDVPSRTEADLAAGADLRAAGDGHNPGDPAFALFQQRVLEQYGVERIEDLPFNFNGLLSLEAERGTTDAQNRFAALRMTSETKQSRIARSFALLSPSVALRRASMALAGTDLEGFHRFLEAAEAHRYTFVQALNQLHADALAYADDISRSRDRSAEQRTRIGADNWALLPEFGFDSVPPTERVRAALPSLAVLAAWVALLGCLVRAALGRLARWD